MTRRTEAATTGRHVASDGGWLVLPTAGAPRWWLPRTPTALATGGLRLYHPMTAKGRMCVRAARFAARLGVFRFVGRSLGPPDPVRELVAPHVPAHGGVAVMANPNLTDRFVALIMDDRGHATAFAKLALTAEGRDSLGQEVEAIATYQRWLVPPLEAPRVLLNGRGILLMEAAEWRLQRQPWRMKVDVAAALGHLFRRSRWPGCGRGLAHGDCTPWNLLRGDSGWILVDWEHAKQDMPPFLDVLHFLLQSHLMLGQPSADGIFRGVAGGQGWVGSIVDAYAEAAEVDRADAFGSLRGYLRATQAPFDPRTPEGRAGIIARQRLLVHSQRWL